MTIVPRMRLGACWARFWKGARDLPGLSLVRLGRSWAAFGQLFDTLGRLSGAFFTLLERSWSHLGSHGGLRTRFWRVLGAYGLDVGELWWQFSLRFSETQH